MLAELYQMLDPILGLSLKANDLTVYNLIARAAFIYVGGIILFRGQREFMMINTPFTFMLNFILGSVLANAIIGTVPYFPIVSMSLFIIFINWLMSVISFYSPHFERFIKGKRQILIEDGQIQWDAMRRNLITKDELLDSVHRLARSENIKDIKRAYFENSGRITIIEK